MKSIYKSFLAALVLAVLMLQSCSETVPSFDEQMETCITDYFKVDSLDRIEVIDTIFVSELDSLQLIYESLSTDMTESKEGTIVRLDSAKAKLARAENEIKEITFDMLIPFAEQNIEDWKNIIIQEEANIAFADSVKQVAENELAFCKAARKSIKGEKAYYHVVTELNKEEKVLAISPDFKVIREE